MINLNETFTVNQDKFISSAFGDEIMLMNLETGDYLALNSVSADIFTQATQKTTANNIINYLINKYDVEEETCKTQVLACLENMFEKEVIIKK
jgi:hypothetical protein